MKHCLIKIHRQESIETHELRRGLGLQCLANRSESRALEFDCRRADCGICIIRITEGIENLSAPTASETDFLQAMRADQEERLACQCRAFGDVTCEVEF